MLTRRQRILLDLLIKCHSVDHHPSPEHLSRLLAKATQWPTGTSPKAVRAELGRLYEEGVLPHLERGAGSSPTKYTVPDCDCEYCGHRV